MFSHFCALTNDDDEYTTWVLDNGQKITWLRYVGWLATSPALLMFLVSTTVVARTDGTAAVEIMPLLVTNQMMILLGSTTSAC